MESITSLLNKAKCSILLLQPNKLSTELNRVRKVKKKKKSKSSCNDRVPLDRLYSKLTLLKTYDK